MAIVACVISIFAAVTVMSLLDVEAGTSSADYHDYHLVPSYGNNLGA